MTSPSITGYRWDTAEMNCAHGYLLPAVERILRDFVPPGDKRLFEVGCGNGAIAAELTTQGWSVTGVDPSTEGIRQANQAYPHIKLEQGSAYDELAEKYGRFPTVLSLEVVEHVYDPRSYARTVFQLLEPRGLAIISTPFHGYFKNVAVALLGGHDRHFNPLWDHGHIKFWSRATLGSLLREAGFVDIEFVRVGRLPPLAKSMIAIARRPG